MIGSQMEIAIAFLTYNKQHEINLHVLYKNFARWKHKFTKYPLKRQLWQFVSIAMKYVHAIPMESL